MKRIFSIILTCCTAFAVAEDDSFFQETDEKVQISTSMPFAAQEPVFEEDEETAKAMPIDAECEDDCPGCDECDDEDNDHVTDDQKQNNEPKEPQGALNLQMVPSLCHPGLPTAVKRSNKLNPPKMPPGSDPKENYLRPGLPPAGQHASYVSWRRYKANFGLEKLFVRFPQKPAISHTSTLLTAYAYDGAVLYSLVGYFPPMGNIDCISWFDSVLYSVDHYPFTLISHVIFQVSNGDWVMDYVSHDYIQNLIIKARAIVTPFNAYTLQCVKPNGMRDYFDYYLDNFFVKYDSN